MKQVTIYTDGACLHNPGRGGWASILILEGTSFRKEISGGFKRTTNNRMEIMAVLQGLRALQEPCEVTIYSDSTYVCHAISKSWVQSWQKKGWIKGDKKKAKNIDLWQQILPLLATHKVQMRWVKGHAGHPENERCDLLAKENALQLNLPEDPGFNENEV